MNKRIVAISVLLLMMCAMAASVFAATKYQFEYAVEVSYDTGKTHNGRPVIDTKKYWVWATTTEEAFAAAKLACAQDVGIGKVTSCGVPMATGKKRVIEE